MSGRLPALKPNDVFRLLQRAGFYLHHTMLKSGLRVTLPWHNRDLKRGTLESVIEQAGSPSKSSQVSDEKIENMAELHITEAEFARDVHAVIEKVRQGADAVIERDGRPVAVITRPEPPLSL